MALEKFNFEVTIKKDKTKKEIKDCLEAVAAKNLDEFGAILVAVPTHGNEEGLTAKDGRSVPVVKTILVTV